MADPNTIASSPMLGVNGVDPVEYARAMRRQQISEMLLKDGTDPIDIQQPTSKVGNLYQQARIGPLAGLSKIVQAYAGSKMLQRSQETQAKYMAQVMQANMPSQGGGQNPNNPYGAPVGPLTRLQMTDPEKYLAAIKPSDQMREAVDARGGSYDAARQQLQDKATHDAAIANKSGEETMLPMGDGRYHSIRTPVLGPDQDFTRGPDGQPAEVHNITGAVPANVDMAAARTAAEEGQRWRNDIQLGGGAIGSGFPADFVGKGAVPPYLRPNGAGAAGPGAAPSAPPAAPQAPQRPSYFPKAQQPAGPQAPQGGVPARAPDGVTFENNLPAGIQKMVVPHSPGRSTDAYTQEIVKSAATKHQQLVDEYGKQSAAGVAQHEYLTAAEKALPNAEVGPMSDWLTHHRGQLIQSFPQLAGVLGGDKVTPTLELNKQLTNAALQGARSTFGSRMTQNEVKLQTEEMSPSVEMTRDALKSLIHQAKMKAAYGIQQDKDYSEYHAAGGDPNRFESMYNVKRPITRFAAQYDTPQPALERLKQRPELRGDFVKKFGWDPGQ